jgi:hypothetical protein
MQPRWGSHVQRRSIVVLPALAFCVSLPLPLIASCQSSMSGNTTSSGGGGSGGSTFAFASGTTGGTAPDGGCSDAAIDTGSPTGCEGIEGGVPYSAVSAIFTGCQGEDCHGAPTAQSTVDVAAYECCDGRLLVDPGNAVNSYLFDKIEGQDLCYGARMPFAEPPLSDADMLTIREWICEGAPSQ